MFLRPAGTRHEGVESGAEESGPRRWRPFETKVQRGRFLIVVAVLLLIRAVALSNLGAEEADRIHVELHGDGQVYTEIENSECGAS